MRRSGIDKSACREILVIAHLEPHFSMTLRFLKRTLSLAVFLACVSGHSSSLERMALKALSGQFGFSGKPPSTGRPTAPPVDLELPRSTGNFGECQSIFANGEPPRVPNPAARKARALCFSGFAVLHSGVTKTAIFSAEVINRQSVAAAGQEERTDFFFADARLPSAERASLEDYRGSGFDRGHLSPAGDRDSAQSMAQSFSLANILPQAPENNRKTWAKSIEKATRSYASRAQGNVYVITGPIHDPTACPFVQAAQVALGEDPEMAPSSPVQVVRKAQSQAGFKAPYRYNAERCTIGDGVAVPSHLFKLVYDATTNRAWVHLLANTDWARATRPISYEDLVARTGIEFLPGVKPKS